MTEPDPDLRRCWPERFDPLMAAYHDQEWGVPVTDDTELFERLSLECFQAGLSWITILRKRDAFRRAFDGFDPTRVSGYGDEEVARLMSDAAIVRNRAKIEATIANARAVLALAAEQASFAASLAAAVPGPPRRLPPDATLAGVPATTPASDALSRHLRTHGFRFVGSTVVYAFMQSVGLVDDHLPFCFRYVGGSGPVLPPGAGAG